jgi:hypothetical protein
VFLLTLAIVAPPQAVSAASKRPMVPLASADRRTRGSR